MFITRLLLTQRHRWCVEKQRIFASLINRSTSLQSSGLQDLLKRLLPKLSAICTLHLCRSLCLRHLHDIVFYVFHLRVLLLSVCLLYVVGLLYHSKLLKTLLSLICTTNMLFERLHQWHQYLFLQLFSINSGVHLISFDLK